MAPFQIYVSRARADERFAEALCGSLRDEFRNLFGLPAGEPQLLCPDDNFDSSQPLADQTERRIDRCAGLIVVLSNAWLASEWCRREFEVFGRRWGDDARERIVVVSKQNVDLRNLPDILRRTQRYDCSEWAAEFEHSPPGTRDPRFFELAERIGERLKRLIARAPAIKEEVAPPQKIFVASPPAEFRDSYRKLLRALEERGVAVTSPPEGLPPADAGAAIDEALHAAELSVHLIGAVGDHPAGLSLAQAQLERAGRRKQMAPFSSATGRRFERVIWIPPGLEAGAGHGLDRIEQVMDRGDRVERCDISELAARLAVELREGQPPAAPVATADDPEIADLLRQRVNFAGAEHADDSPSLFVGFRSETRSLADADPARRPDPWNDTVKIPELAKVARDTVDVSAFAPKAAEPGAQVLVQIFLHLSEQLKRAQKMARGFDSRTTPRISTLQISIPRGERVDVALTCETLGVAQQLKTIRWTGEPSFCQFLLNIPADVRQKNHFIHVELLVGGLPVGELTFDLKIRERCDPAERNRQPQGKSSRPYRHAFLSYASPDRVEVLRHAHLLNVLHTKFFQDLLSLQPGERWERRLYEEIGRCDLFLLFWCEHAAKSEWVIREAEFALACQKASPKGLPHIRPLLLHGPRVRPPGPLAELHFNDPIASIIAGEEARSVTK